MYKSFFNIQLFCFFILFILSTYAAASPYNSPDEQEDWTPPKLISLPDGFQPEGAVKGPGHYAYVGSLKTGGIYKVNLVTGKGELLVDSAPTPALGMAYDKRTHYLYVAGGPSGTVTVYDTDTGKEKAVYTLATSGSFINDGVVTRKAVYFTDSYKAVIYGIPLKYHGWLANSKGVKTIPLSGDFKLVADNFNGNGIETTKTGKKLYVVNSASGELYVVDPQSGHATQVAIDNGNVVNGDGILRRGDKLYVVQNFLDQIAELKLSDDGLSATISNLFTDPNFEIPTSVIGFGHALYVLNARFDVAPPPFPPVEPSDPGLKFNLVRIDLNGD